jgi:hypothetical protein
MGVMRFVDYVRHEQNLLQFNKVNSLRWKFPACLREKEHIQVIIDGYDDRQKKIVSRSINPARTGGNRPA